MLIKAMKTRIIAGMAIPVLILYSLMCLNSVPIIVKAQSLTSVHNLDTHANYTTISAAIADPQTQNGQTIFVEDGIYFENVMVNKSLALFGESEENTILDGSGSSYLIMNILMSNVSVSNFTIRNTLIGLGQDAYAAEISNESQNVLLENVTFRDSMYGLVFDESSSLCRVMNCMFSNNSVNAIRMQSGSNNSFIGNALFNNTAGVSFSQSNHNFYFHNNFVNNSIQIELGTLTVNTWNGDVEGNYWSDYDGSDANFDGIGDTPWPLPGMDRYPLMGVFSEYAVLPDSAFGVITNSTILDFGFSQANATITMHVSNSTANQTSGFCRITIPTNAIPPGILNVTINGTVVPYTMWFVNSSITTAYFSYTQSTQEIVIVPEYTITLLLILLPMILTALVATDKKGKTRQGKIAN